MSNKERAFEKKMADAAEKAKKKEESDRKKAEKIEKEMRNIQHRKAVYDAANAANIPHNMIYYTRTKNVNAIVNAAARKLTAKKKKCVGSTRSTKHTATPTSAAYTIMPFSFPS